MKCIILLSTKSAGSSAIQNLLTQHNTIQKVKYTRHEENETLFFSKSASALGLEQISLYESEVPIPKNKAQKELKEFLKLNAGFDLSSIDEKSIFEGWKSLCETHKPVLFEKSPHHIFQYSNLQLIQRCIDYNPDVEFLIIGLIRNPMDVLYSYFSRWYKHPKKIEDELTVAFENFTKCESLFGQNYIQLRYEDLVNEAEKLKTVAAFAEIPLDELDLNYLHKNSVSKWVNDANYGYILPEKLSKLAQHFGYSEMDLSNQKSHKKVIYNKKDKFIYDLKQTLGKQKKKLGL